MSALHRQQASRRMPSQGGKPLQTPFSSWTPLFAQIGVRPEPAWSPAPPRFSAQVSGACRAVLLMTKRDLCDLCFEGFVDVEDRQNRPELVSLLQVGVCLCLQSEWHGWRMQHMPWYLPRHCMTPLVAEHTQSQLHSRQASRRIHART